MFLGVALKFQHLLHLTLFYCIALYSTLPEHQYQVIFGQLARGLCGSFHVYASPFFTPPVTSWKPQKGCHGAASRTKRCRICTKIRWISTLSWFKKVLSYNRIQSIQICWQVWSNDNFMFPKLVKGRQDFLF